MNPKGNGKVRIMIDSFFMNGMLWRIRFVNPNSDILIDRTLSKTVAVTDPDSMTIYLSNQLSGSFLNRVLIHELGHCVMYSYGLVNEIHRMCKKRYWIEMEEFCANLLADYGNQVFGLAYAILGNRAIHIVPYEIERLVA